MKLLTANIYPDVVRTKVNIRVAGKTEAIDIEKGREALVRDGDIDVLHGKYVADIAIFSIIGLSAHLLRTADEPVCIEPIEWAYAWLYVKVFHAQMEHNFLSVAPESNCFRQGI